MVKVPHDVLKSPWPNAVFMAPFFCCHLKPRSRARRASQQAHHRWPARGWATMSDSAPVRGMPRRTGLRKMSSPSSTMPGMTALPPVSTMPEDSSSS